MKKSLVCTSVLALLSLGLLVTSHVQLSESARHLTYTEHPITGDLSAAEGVSLELRAEMDRRLFWDTNIIPGQEGQAEFRFSPKRVPYGEHNVYGSLDLYNSLATSASTSGSFEDELEEWFLPQVLKKLAAETGPGETRETTVSLKDYIDYYPVQVDLRTTAVSRHWDMGDHGDRSMLVQFANAFRFPVLEGHRETFSVTRDPAGALNQLSYSPAGKTGVSIYSTSFCSKDFLYFVVEARDDENDQLLDYSGTPNGYGIYALPMDKEDLTVDDLRFVYPLDGSARPREMTYNHEEGELLYITDPDGVQLLHRVNAVTWQEEQALPICTLSEMESGIFHLLHKGDLLLAFQGEKSAHLLQKDNGGDYVYRFPLHFPDNISYRNLINNVLDYFYDGDRLVLLSPLPEDEDGPAFAYFFNTSYALYVFGAEGTRYAGYFASGLDIGRNEVESSRNCCQLADSHPLTLIQPKGGTDHA